MKTFKDLNFEPAKIDPDVVGLHAKEYFPNGFGISVMRVKSPVGYQSRTDNESEWEAAVLKRESDGKYHVCDDLSWTQDVFGYLSKEDVTALMKRIQELKP